MIRRALLMRLFWNFYWFKALGLAVNGLCLTHFAEQLMDVMGREFSI
jgi:hypothetical protein|tara:strand:+ start:1154 stop:1294 length:141 start_codon:yes stop_codon:yes gene_type:complete